MLRTAVFCAALAGCGGAGLQTIQIVNKSPRAITEVYVFPTGAGDHGAYAADMKFLGRFAAAWGTFWLVGFGLAFAANAKINLGAGATILVMLGCALYAAVRGVLDRSQPDRLQRLEEDNTALRALVRQLSGSASPPSVPHAYVHRANPTPARTDA